MEFKKIRDIVKVVAIVAFIFTVIFLLMAIDDDDFLIGLVFTGSILVLCVQAIIANEFYEIARQKGHDDMKFFWYSFIFGAIGYFMVIALPDRNATSHHIADELPEI